jgi:hypothetical protein
MMNKPVLRELPQEGRGHWSFERLINRLEHLGVRVPSRKFLHNRITHLCKKCWVRRTGWGTYCRLAVWGTES